MTKEKKSKKEKDTPDDSALPIVDKKYELAKFKEIDKYTLVKQDLKKVVEQALDSYQEKTEGRMIDYVALRLLSKYGVFVRTGQGGNIEVLMSGTELDNKTGEEIKQRLEIGLNAEVATKAKETTSTNLMKRKNIMAKNFEVISSAYEVIKETIEESQDLGMQVQKEIDEEDKKFWGFIHEEGKEESINFNDNEEININNIVKLVTIARQVVTDKLGAKLQQVDVLFFKIIESFILTDTDKNCKDSSIPRVGFVIQVNTKDGNSSFETIRGVGNLEVLRRYTMHPEEEKPLVEIIKKLAEKVADEALALDRAQSSSILGSEVPVILSDAVTGVFIHEILGHPSEADIIVDNKNDKLSEINLKGRIGSTVIENTKFNMVDTGDPFFKLGDYQVKNAFGSIPFDCHGSVSKTTEIVKEGVFINPLTDRYNINEVADGLKQDIKEQIKEHGLSGNSRTPDYKFVTQIRMTNTYLLPNEEGYSSVEDMARDIPKNKKGVYIKSCNGGWINTHNGEFCIKGNLGYLIENGVITDKPLNDVTFMGNISKIGNSIQEIGSSKTIKRTFTGHCGKRSRKDRDTAWIPVESGGPAIYIDQASIGSLSAMRWFNICKEYSKQSMEINDGKRLPEEFHIKEIEDINPKNVDQQNLCLINQMSVEEEIKVLTSGMKSIVEFSINDDGKVSKIKSRY